MIEIANHAEVKKKARLVKAVLFLSRCTAVTVIAATKTKPKQRIQ